MAEQGSTLDDVVSDVAQHFHLGWNRRHAWLDWTTTSILLLFSVGAMLTSGRIRELVHGPLSELTDVADRVASGEEDTRAPEQGPHELRQLAAALNAALDRHAADQRRLAQRTERLTEAQRVAHLGSWQRSADSDVSTWSDETYRITGTDPATFQPTSAAFEAMVVPEDRPNLHAARARFEAGETIEPMLLRLRRPDGALRWVRLRAVVRGVDAVSPNALEGTLQDVTDLVEVQHELEEERRLHEMASRLGRVGGWSLDLPSYEVHWSDVVSEIHGTPKGWAPDVEGGIAFYAPWARPIIRDAVQRAIDPGESFDVELEIDTTAGRRIWIRTVGRPLHDDGGDRIGVEGAFQDIDAKKRSEERAQRLDRRLREVLESLPDGFVALDDDGVPSFANDAARALLGRERWVDGTHVRDLLPGSVAAEVGESLQQAVRQRRSDTFVAADVPNGRWLELDLERAGTSLVLIVRDVSQRARMTSQLFARETELIRARDELERTLDWQRTLLSALPAHVALLDGDGTILDVNDRWRAYGRENGAGPQPAAEGWNYLEVARRAAAKNAASAGEVADGLAAVLRGDREAFALEYPCHAPDQERWFQFEARAVPGPNGEGRRAVVMHVDVTENHRARDRLARLAFEDPLTGLPNRNGFVREVTAALAGAWPTDALIASLDVRGMSAVNDLHGFERGDALLRSIATRLRQNVGPSDRIGRIGGDEFAVLIGSPGDDGEDAEADAVERLRHLTRTAIDAPHDLTRDLRVTVDAHVGLSRLGEERRPAEQVLREAQLALFEGEGGPGAVWTEFDAALDEKVHGRMQLADELRTAIDHDQLRLNFHPEVYARSGKLFAAEALVRWEHPERGLLGPGAFVPLAEQTGLILPLGRWVLDRACRKLASWKDDLGLTRLAVNASAEELRSGGYAQVVLDTLARHDVPPTMLTIEVTESALAREYGVVADELRALREAGVRVALDDFGTGYASLAYLKRFPFDHVKIDRMFVADMVNDAYSRSVIETVVALARTLGASVIGEGVESEAQRRMLIDLQCEIAQGFHFCLPLDEEDFEWLLSNRQKLPIGAGT
jgi:diguanylate cyclase (GGDEF)-like protein